MRTYRLGLLFRAVLWAVTLFLACMVFAVSSEVLLSLCVKVLAAAALVNLLVIEIFPWLIPFFPSTIGRGLGFIRSSFIDIYSVILAHCASPFRQSAYNPANDEGGEPVVFIHGYLTTSGLWFYFRRKCKAAGCRNLFFVDLGAPLGSIEEHVEKLRREVKRIVGITGKTQLKLVGHSMGGLVAACYISRFAEEEEIEVTDFVSLAAPFYGTPWGKLGPGISPKQMGTGSEFLRSLRQAFLTKPVRSLFLESSSDWVVVQLDPEFVNMRKEYQHVRIDDIGHGTFVFSERAIQEVVAFLGCHGNVHSPKA